MKPHQKTMNKDQILKDGKRYLEQATASLEKTDAELLIQLRNELSEFTHVVEDKWKNDKRLNWSSKRELKQLEHELRQRELILAKRIVELQKSQALLIRLEKIALPEPTTGLETRDFSTWSMWPVRITPRLKQKLAVARLPQ